jgi:hypothetical protein
MAFVHASWRVDGDAEALQAAIVLREHTTTTASGDDPGEPPDGAPAVTLQPGDAGGPCELSGAHARDGVLLRQQRAPLMHAHAFVFLCAVVLPCACAVQRCTVWSNARTLELFASASGGAHAWEYITSVRGAAASGDDALFCVDFRASDATAVHGTMVKLRLLSLRPAGVLRLRGVRIVHAAGGAAAVADTPAAALASVLKAAGGVTPAMAPGNAAFMDMLGAMAAGMRSGAPLGTGPPPPDTRKALRKGAAGASGAGKDAGAASSAAAVAPRVEALDAAVSGLEARLGVASASAGPASAAAADAAPQRAVDALTQRVAALEERLDRAVADFGARLAALEQARTPGE